MNKATCPLCGSANFSQEYMISDYLLSIPGIFVLVKCSLCGLLYQNPRLDIDEVAFYYPESYDPFMLPPWLNPNPVQRVMTLYGLKKRWAVVEKYAPLSRNNDRRHILDVGCATGVFLASGNENWKKTGVELNKKAAKLARDMFGLKVYQGVLSLDLLNDGLFDVITMWDVLEHLYDPMQTLNFARKLLHRDGVFIARVPNYASIDARIFGCYWAGLDQPRHAFVPDTYNLRKMLEKAGFEVIDIISIGGTYAMTVLSWRFLLTKYIENKKINLILQKLLDNIIIRILLWPVFWIIDYGLHKGSMITVIAKPYEKN